MDQENLKRFFVGEKFDKLYYKNFSFWALLFGPFYYFYRKLVGKGFLFLLLEIIISVCILELDKTIVFLALGLIRIASALLFNSTYRKYVSKKVDKIANKSQNEQIAKTKCMKKGKPSVGLVVFFCFIYIILAIVVVVAFNVFILGKDILSEITKNIGINITFNGNVEDESSEEDFDEEDITNTIKNEEMNTLVNNTNTINTNTNVSNTNTVNTNTVDTNTVDSNTVSDENIVNLNEDDKNTNSNKNKEKSDTILNSKVTISDEGYSALNSIDSNELRGYIKYSINGIFEEDSFWKGKYSYRDSTQDMFNKTTFSVEGYGDLEDITEKKFEKITSKYNDVEWTILEHTNENSSILIYAYAEIDNIYVVAKYEIEENVKDKETARRYFEDIMNSMEYLK